MSTIDIRKHVNNPTRIIFGEKGSDGLEKAIALNKAFPVQVEIETNGTRKACHIKYADIDSLIEALKLAKQLWENK